MVMDKPEEKQFKTTVLSAYRNSRTIIAAVLILGSISIGILAAPTTLNYYLENNYPVFDGNITVGYQYLVEGSVLGYDTSGSYIAIQTEYGIMQVSILDMKDRIGYQICQHAAGDRIKYIVIIQGNNSSGMGNIDFLLMREICY